MARLRIDKLTSARRKLGLSIPRSTRGWMPEYGFEIRLSLLANENFEEGKAALGSLWSFHNFRNLTEEERATLFSFEGALNRVLFSDAPVHHYREALRELTPVFFKMHELGGEDFIQHLDTFEALGRYLESRSTLELLLSRHMRAFMRALVGGHAYDFSRDYNFLEIIAYTSLKDDDVALLLRALRDRELLLKFPSDFRLGRYFEFMGRLGRLNGLSEELLHELEDELLVDLQWFGGNG